MDKHGNAIIPPPPPPPSSVPEGRAPDPSSVVAAGEGGVHAGEVIQGNVDPAGPSGAGAIGTQENAKACHNEAIMGSVTDLGMLGAKMGLPVLDENMELVSGYESLKGRLCTLWKTMQNQNGTIGQRGKYWEHRTRPDTWIPATRGRIGGFMSRIGRGYKAKMKKHWGKRLKMIGNRWASKAAKSNSTFQGQVASHLRHRGRDTKLGIIGQRVLTSITR